MLLPRSAIFVLLVACCSRYFSQTFQYSRDYEALKGNVPLRIINTSHDYFYLLRYNKPIHDFIIERRHKKSGRMLSFTPLMLDSVNADWFDYEDLNFRCFVSGRRLCFAFEKALNTQSSIFVKLIDTSGHSAGFRKLAHLVKDANTVDVRFVMQQTADNHLLVVGEELLVNRVTKKTALLYSPQTENVVWTKKLPFENVFTGYSTLFECNRGGDLFFTQHFTRLLGTRRVYIDHTQVTESIVGHDSLFLVILPRESNAVFRQKLPLRDSSILKNISLLSDDMGITVLLHYTAGHEGGGGRVYFISQRFNLKGEIQKEPEQVGLDPVINKQLTFYDGSDDPKAGAKDYENHMVMRDSTIAWIIAGREEKNYSKEALVLALNSAKGQLLSQHLLPRKIFYFENRTRYKYLGAILCGQKQQELFCFLLEARRNHPLSAEQFNFSKFEKQKYQWGAGLVCYRLNPYGGSVKKTVYINSGYDVIPVPYQGPPGELLFYQSNGKKERFAILSLEDW